MPLHIECENGHKLVCPESLAGSSVICPKCGSRVDVSARNVAKGGRTVSEVAVASVSGLFKNVAVVAEPAGPAPSGTKLADISFSCPNGHRLHGPRSLQGQVGECPKCKTKFRVPVIDWQVAGEGQTSGTPASQAVGQAAQDTAVGLPPQPTTLGREDADDDDDDISLDGIEEIDAASVLSPPQPTSRATTAQARAADDSATHPLEQLMLRLWRERAHGGVVEVHLDTGAVLVPDWWAAGQSTKSYGLFAVQTAEGTYEMHAVIWSHVRQISVRGLSELPGGVFEGT